jgi:hypothetical protein
LYLSDSSYHCNGQKPQTADRTFFFFAAEDLQQRSSPNPISIQVPTAAELTGDFSSLLAKGIAIYNPATGAPYPGNIINTPIDTLSGKLAQKYLVPLASNPTTGIFNPNSNQNIDSTQDLVKIDHTCAANNHLSGRYFYNQDNFQRPFTAPTGFYAANRFRNQSVTFNRVNFGNPANANTAPVATVSRGTYGQITSANSPRVFQFGLKLLF